ncbi:MAG: 4-phosphopantetheinyl transferase family protein [Flavobacterium sp.]|nr:MAG: 4-phosphopantetheinyl transferase family protein [Flavobacterium sp.]
MIGNDVVDLVAARSQSNWQRKGFLQKLFSAEEQRLIAAASEASETMVWILWSMKEAAYKIYNRETGVRGYIPHKLLCSDVAITNLGFIGKVNCEDRTYYTVSTIQDNVIHTIAVKVQNDLERISEIKNKTIFKDNKGIPYIYDSDGNPWPASVSHHGNSYNAVSLV